MEKIQGQGFCGGIFKLELDENNCGELGFRMGFFEFEFGGDICRESGFLDSVEIYQNLNMVEIVKD